MNLQGLDHIALSVRDVEHSVAWYVEVLGLEQQHEAMWDGVPKFVGKGATGIAFFPAEGKDDSLGRAERSRMLHFAFRANRKDFLGAQRELENRGIQFHFDDHGIAHSIYFCDPDGHKIEITTYELQ